MTSTPNLQHAHPTVKPRPKVARPTEYGNAAAFWVEYPSGLLDLSRSAHLPSHEDGVASPPLNAETQWELAVDGGRTLRLSKVHTALVVIDMQK